MGSNPTPRTTDEPTVFGGFEEFLRSKKTRKGYRLAERTVSSKIRIIKMLAKNVNLWDSDEVQRFIDESSWTNGRRNNVSTCYQDWCKYHGFSFQRMKYHVEEKIPYIPSENEIDQLIGGFSSKYAAFLQLLKESAFRPVEASRLTPNDVDLVRRVVTLNVPAKYGRPRQIRISVRSCNMFEPLMANRGQSERIWDAKLKNISDHIRKHRNQVALKLSNPRLKKITLKTFRHWKATMEYHRTKDILFVKQLLGHKSIKNTLIYTHLVDFGEEDNFTVKIATTLDEFTALLESGFEYVSDYGDAKVCRKRK